MDEAVASQGSGDPPIPPSTSSVEKPKCKKPRKSKSVERTPDKVAATARDPNSGKFVSQHSTDVKKKNKIKGDDSVKSSPSPSISSYVPSTNFDHALSAMFDSDSFQKSVLQVIQQSHLSQLLPPAAAVNQSFPTPDMGYPLRNPAGQGVEGTARVLSDRASHRCGLPGYKYNHARRLAPVGHSSATVTCHPPTSVPCASGVKSPSDGEDDTHTQCDTQLPQSRAYRIPRLPAPVTDSNSPTANRSQASNRHRSHSWFGARRVSQQLDFDSTKSHAPTTWPFVATQRAGHDCQISDVPNFEQPENSPGTYGHADTHSGQRGIYSSARAKSSRAPGESPLSTWPAGSPQRSDPDSEFSPEPYVPMPIHGHTLPGPFSTMDPSVSGDRSRPRGRSPVRRSTKRVHTSSDSDSPRHSPVRSGRFHHQESFSPGPDSLSEEDTAAPSLMKALKKTAAKFVPDFKHSGSSLDRSTTTSRFSTTSGSRSMIPSSVYTEALRKGEEAWFGDLPDDFHKHFTKKVRYNPPLPLSKEFFYSVSQPTDSEKKFCCNPPSHVSVDLSSYKRLESTLNVSLALMSQVSSLLEGVSSLLGHYLDPDDPTAFNLNSSIPQQDLGLLLAALSDVSTLATSSTVDARLHLVALMRHHLLNKVRSISSQEKLDLMAGTVQSNSVFDRETLKEVSSAIRKRKVEESNQLLLERALKSPHPSTSRGPAFPRSKSSIPKRSSSQFVPSRKPTTPRRSSSAAPSTRGKKRTSTLFR